MEQLPGTGTRAQAWGCPAGAGGSHGSKSGKPAQETRCLSWVRKDAAVNAVEACALDTEQENNETDWTRSLDRRAGGPRTGSGRGPRRGVADELLAGTGRTCSLPRPHVHTSVPGTQGCSVTLGARYAVVLNQHLRNEGRVFEALPNLASCLPSCPAGTRCFRGTNVVFLTRHPGPCTALCTRVPASRPIQALGSGSHPSRSGPRRTPPFSPGLAHLHIPRPEEAQDTCVLNGRVDRTSGATAQSTWISILHMRCRGGAQTTWHLLSSQRSHPRAVPNCQ